MPETVVVSDTPCRGLLSTRTEGWLDIHKLQEFRRPPKGRQTNSYAGFKPNNETRQTDVRVEEMESGLRLICSADFLRWIRHVLTLEEASGMVSEL